MASPATTDRREPTTWDPFAEVRDVLAQLSRFPDSWNELTSPSGHGFTPLADVEETDEAYIVEVELPGVDKAPDGSPSGEATRDDRADACARPDR
jgi:HSP20 family protein